ncbi:hypothetical protein [Mycobacterium marinum]|uniref:hypothetical protein n=1 Tax=Mycobacterium marinum TaxID=1781 RepID=UPI0035690FFA
MEKADIERIIQQKSQIEQNIDKHTKALNQCPKMSNGYIKETDRNTSYYQWHKKELDKHMQCLKNFNSLFTNQQKREISKYRREQKQLQRL